jgi:hypothetical protein
VTLELFRCEPLGVKLTRKSCGDRHVRAGRELRHEGKQGQPLMVGAQRCAACPIGGAHARGETPDVELVAAPTLPEPGRSKWTSAEDLPSAPPPPMPRSIRPPPPTTEGKPMPRPPKKHTYNGKTLTAYAWADEPEAKAIGIGRQALFERLRTGWAIEEALTVPPGQRRAQASRKPTEERLEEMVRPAKAAPKKPAPKREAPKPKVDVDVPPLRVVWFAAGVEITSSTDPLLWAETLKRTQEQR